MNNFWSLVKFEYKKFITIKTMIAFAVLLLFTAVSALGVVIGNTYVDGEIASSKYESFMIDKRYSIELSGRVLDETLLKEVVTAFAIYDEDASIDEARYISDIYLKPYNDVLAIVRNVYGIFGYEEIGDITDEQIANFYEIRQENVGNYIKSIPLNNNSKEMLLDLSEKRETPIVMGYKDSYILSMSMMDSSSLVMAFFLAFLFSGIFAKEYQTNVISLQLTSRKGKRSLFLAKMFTVFSATILVALLVLLVNFFTCMVAYGFEGANTALQNHLVTSPYPFTVFEAAIINFTVIFFACLFLVSLINILSSKCKTPFLVLAFCIVVILLPIFIPIPETLPTLFRIMQLFPSNSFLYLNNFSVLVYELPFVSMPPYIFVPVFYIVASTFIVFITYKNYINHQVR